MGKIADRVRVFLELVKFEHSIFALPYAYIGALYGAASVLLRSETRPLSEIVPSTPPTSSVGYLKVYPTEWVTAAQWPTWQALLWITVVMVGARSFAFVVNRAVDKEIDARNPRTAGRAIPAGLVKAWELWLFAAAVLAAFLFGVWQLAPITRWLWPVVLGVFLVYPYTKRFTPLCHYWLGLCLGLAPVGAWVAVGGDIADAAPWVFGLGVTLWTAGFDIIYATQDVECDIRDGIHSMPADLGIARALVQTRVMHAFTVVCFVAGGALVGAGWPWFVGVGIATALLAWENWVVRADDLSRLDAAFFTTNGVIAVILGLAAVIDRFMA